MEISNQPNEPYPVLHSTDCIAQYSKLHYNHATTQLPFKFNKLTIESKRKSSVMRLKQSWIRDYQFNNIQPWPHHYPSNIQRQQTQKIIAKLLCNEKGQTRWKGPIQRPFIHHNFWLPVTNRLFPTELAYIQVESFGWGRSGLELPGLVFPSGGG